jgi:anti-anti-sigma regulatory factor
MGVKLSARQQAQLAWLESLPRSMEKAHRIIELMAVHQADESNLRSLARMLDELKAQGSSLNLTAMAESFGIMGMMLRRAGGHQIKVRGLRELLAGAKINLDGAIRVASTPERDAEPDEKDGKVSP